MSYKLALEAAGASVLAYESFGSYQGDWWAKVAYGDVTGYVNGTYGSCSMCDAFESEFGDAYHYIDDNTDHSIYNLKDGCAKCDELRTKLHDFGKSYLEGLIDKDAAIEHASRHANWDCEVDGMVKWLKSH